ncbi:Mg(2+) transport ATPase protein C (plasmid) [Sinorhizobium sojae CCBAU 05684]|uniref:Protein MgtC n=2 Tax=Sinorhizobium sojae TaxID=716925 RepID=A0A249PGT0_9HYPH|nr:Mg(2+) transport ATPase protein C [Sinorhizobium sojae CCBAU 05684]
MELGFDLERLNQDLIKVMIAFALALPIGWERGRGRYSVGFRTLPIVSVAACGFALVAGTDFPGNAEAQARVLQGVVTGIGFIGGGAIVKLRHNVKGLVTAASIWNAGAIGAAVGLGNLNIAVVLSIINLTSLVVLAYLNADGDDDESSQS